MTDAELAAVYKRNADDLAAETDRLRADRDSHQREAIRAMEETVKLKAIIAAAARRTGDIKAVITRWEDGGDTRPVREIRAEIEHIAFSVRCYLDGVPGPYLSPVR